jgi:hypothetical protein
LSVDELILRQFMAPQGGGLRVGARLDKPRGGVIWLIHGFFTIILTIASSKGCTNRKPLAGRGEPLVVDLVPSGDYGNRTD